MKEIIEHLLLVEKEAKKIIADAEEQSRRIIEEATIKSRQTVQERKEAATVEGQKLYEKMIEDAQTQKKAAIEQSSLEDSPGSINSENRQDAIRFIASAITGLE